MTYLLQQRKILSEIGIDWWVRPSSPTIELSDKKTQPESEPVNNNPIALFDKVAQSVIVNPTDTFLTNQCLTTDAQINPVSAISCPVENTSNLNTPENARVEDLVLEKKEIVQPFRLQAIYLNHWVLLVDEDVLQLDEQEPQRILWSNICQALDKPVERLKFPLVHDVQMVAMSSERMDTLELAKATLAGFIFRMVRTDEVKIAGLNELPEGLDDPRLVRLPLLNEMVSNPMLKQELWESLSRC